MHFVDACASLWIDGELVHLEDLVLDDAFRDTRTPTHPRTHHRPRRPSSRRRIATQSPDWAPSAEGIRTLRKNAEITPVGAEETEAVDTIRRAVAIIAEAEGEDDVENLPGIDCASIDAVLARSEAAIDNASRPGRRAAKTKIR